ncbi:MAG TPA: sulfatase-like hydrolase/transferase [Gammaproteobacteria bacterium]|nr:sulfatase-like hydrolase/transferase [Gammaproteobacteria bacterium]
MAVNEYVRATARVVLYAFAYVLLEWLFLVTKPSFLGAWSLPEQFNALLVGVVPFLAAALGLHAISCLAAFSVSRLFPQTGGISILLKVVPALIAAAIVLMLVDNFTYTVFGWGIVDTTWVTAPFYWLLALLVFIYYVRRQPGAFKYRPLLATVLVLASGAALAWPFYAVGDVVDSGYASSWGGDRLPNIVMFAADGVNAGHTSAYGYARETTPNLDRYLGRALIADNAFTNSGWTTGSLTSMMTGKYPATTKVLYPPYTLKGRDAYENLPRILRTLGYASIQETVRYYADGADLNWAGSFDFANGRAIDWSPLGAWTPVFQGPLMFSDRLYQRLADRVGQLLFIKKMVNRYEAVTSNEYAEVYGISDKVRMEHVFDFIKRTRRPFFVHIHLMGTHCCGYHPQDPHFSARDFSGWTETKMARFDDTILQSDRYFGQLMALLSKRHLLDNTLVIYSSDHAAGWDFRSRVPLIFLFPGSAHSGHIKATTQLLDVAPTILDYLNVPVPEWMEGQSLLQGNLDPHRPVFSIYRMTRKHFDTDNGDTLARVVHMGPPTYGLQTMGMVVCRRWYLLSLDDGKVKAGTIGNYQNKWRATAGATDSSAPCPDDDHRPTNQEARVMMSRFLHARGFQF